MIHGKNVQVVTANALGPTPSVSMQLGSDVLATAVVEITGGTATVSLEGRISPEAPWFALATTPASLSAPGGVFAVSRGMTEMRGNISAIAGATVRIWFQA